MKKYELTALLGRYTIPFHTWGKGKAKTLEHLLQEVNSGEAVLQREGETLVQYLRVVLLDICYQDGETRLKLKEEKQIFKDGRVRVRGYPASLSGKLEPDESPYAGAYRALRQELKITARIPIGTLIF